MVRTRFAPSPTGYMHIGNLRTALYEYLIAKSLGGVYVLRIEDTDTQRHVEGAMDFIYRNLKLCGLNHDEGPDVGGSYGPYIQSERRSIYMKYALELVEKGKAYYCFCTKERLDSLQASGGENAGYDKHCRHLPTEQVQKHLASGDSFVIRQLIPEGHTTFHDEVYGDITIENNTLDDQVLMKSDGLPTYNFANVVDDHLMEISHVVRGSEYLSSAPKYNLLYEAFGWDIPKYVHLPLIVKTNGEKISKRKGDASFEDLLEMGFLAEAVLNYIALLGWSPGDNREFFTLEELVGAFKISGISKSPSAFDMTKLTWMNGEYFKKMDFDAFYALAEPFLWEAVKKPGIDLKVLGEMVKSRISFVKEIPKLLDFIDVLPSYSTELYVHKKMKTTEENSLVSLEKALAHLRLLDEPWSNELVHGELFKLIEEMGIKNGQMLWPIRTALSGKPTSPCGATELLELLGKEESIKRIEKGIEMLRE